MGIIIIRLAFVNLLCFYACSNSSSKTPSLKEDTGNNLKIDLSEQGLFFNSSKISSPVEYKYLKSILGEPNKSEIPNQTEIDEVKLKFGSNPNNIYTYDKDGLMIYQNILSHNITSISIDFKKHTNSFSPIDVFSGLLNINGVVINSKTKPENLDNISGLTNPKVIYNHITAKFKNYLLSFIFDKNDATLADFSIEFDSDKEKIDSKGWADSDKDILKATISNAEKVKSLASQYGFKISDVADCYVAKLTVIISKDELYSLNISKATQQRISKIIENCMKEAIKK